MTPVSAPVRRWAGPLLAALVLALVAAVPAGAADAAPSVTAVTAVTAPAAVARSCTVKVWSKTAVQQAAEGADAVIVARITKAVKASTSWGYTIRVVATFRGAAQHGATATMRQVPATGRPGTPLTKGATYLLFLHQKGARFTAERCGGSVLLAHGLSPALRSKLSAALTVPAGPGVTVQWSEPKGGVRNVPSLNRLIAPGVGLALIGVLGLMLIARMARSSRTP
ncbi:MAG TPA: hypothetical protein VN088_09725 [Nocardioides sp.]|nr:hypothetical protein [Nocardioides sp.]